jgi:uncharacterized phiE125 gp8 family phage protein
MTPAYTSATVSRRPRILIGVDAEPITIEQARRHIEAQPYDDSELDTADDDMIAGFIAAAREYCENFTGLSFAPVTLELTLDGFPTKPVTNEALAIELPFGPVREVLSITHGDGSDDALAVWGVDLDSAPARITPAGSGGSWATVDPSTALVRIRYTAGYGPKDSDGFGEPLPASLRAAMLLMIGNLYLHREAVNVGNIVTQFPLSVHSLLRPYRVLLGMA